jgi:hypothetical protein
MFVKFGVVDGNNLNSSTDLNIADALDDAVTTNRWRFVDWTPFLGAKGFAGRPSDGDAAHQRQGLRSIWVGGAVHPRGYFYLRKSSVPAQAVMPTKRSGAIISQPRIFCRVQNIYLSGW